ncbi:MAG: hypothetical protein ACRC67_15645 [Inquilinus sp.]|uniref:hypothetical protein n=1 Tax=Inquilinus sp. TaxID=1932117 RepID=UPI003F339E0C
MDESGGERLSAEVMEHHPWQKRARAAGLTQKALADIIGQEPTTVSRQLRGKWARGVPQHTIAAILAWEVMSPALRKKWMMEIADSRAAREIEAETERQPESLEKELKEELHLREEEIKDLRKQIAKLEITDRRRGLR